MSTSNYFYIGPVLYLIHSPRRERTTPRGAKPGGAYEYDDFMWATHNKRVVDALKKAASTGTPVIWDYMGASHREEALSAVKRMMPAQTFEKLRVVWANTNIHDMGKETLRDVCRSAKIFPSTIVAVGSLRSICVTEGLKLARRAFPKTHLVMLEGAYTVHPKSESMPRGFRLPRSAYKKELSEIGVTFSKKLAPKKHFKQPRLDIMRHLK